LLDEVTNATAITGAYDFILQVYAMNLESLSSVVLKKLLRIPTCAICSRAWCWHGEAFHAASALALASLTPHLQACRGTS